jgi:diketogulonate reductase-like aldo/keto reductase
MSTDGRVHALADGNRLPLLGLGVWQVPNGPKCENAVRWALELGYRHIDTAQVYGNEESVGRALHASGVPRDEIFLTTKFYPDYCDPEVELCRSLERLGVEQVDLYLFHYPQSGATWAWTGMEAAQTAGYARSIGVSNFSAAQLEEVLSIATIPPVVNQVQFSPFEMRLGLLEACRAHDVVLEAYSPLGTGRHLRNVKVRNVAKAVSRTPAQVLLRWSLQRGAVVIPKSTHRKRIAGNAAIFDFELPEEHMAALDALDRTGGTDRAREEKWWEDGEPAWQDGERASEDGEPTLAGRWNLRRPWRR